MVKRLIAVFVGASAAVALFFAVAWARERIHDAEAISVTDCVRDGLVDCVGYEAPKAPEIVAPCKAWLDGDGSTAALSQCLHEARREDGVRAVRTLAIATSS